MTTLLALNVSEARTADAVFERLFPADERGAGASQIGVLTYVDRALAGAYAEHRESYRLGLQSLDRAARTSFGDAFANCTDHQQTELIAKLERGELPSFSATDQTAFFELLLAHCQEGLFADPVYGGNRDKLGWKTLGHPGVSLTNSAEEQLSADPVTKGGTFTTLEDLTDLLSNRAPELDLPNFDPQRGRAEPAGKVDVVIVGVGAVGGLIAPILTDAGLHVVGLEAGPYRALSDYIPDELGASYYCRQNLGAKFMSEQIRWRRTESEATQDPGYSLGRMMNGVGGSVVHYGGWLRRYHPHHFRQRSTIIERWGAETIPPGCTVADWPVGYDELEPYFSRVEHEGGVAGDELNPFIKRSKPLPLPPTRPFRMGTVFTEATKRLGLHPHAVPVGQNTRPFNGFPETEYSAWNNGFGALLGDKWHPGLTSVPKALASGRFDLRTHCRVTRVITNTTGRATGVEYFDPAGVQRVQEADAVIVAAYTWENMRLMFLSTDEKHPGGLGNRDGQLGKHLMIKQFPHIGGFFPDQVFNRHLGPASQSVVLDDFVAEGFDPMREGGFVGGATLGGENQFLPIQISRESLPPRVPRWGAEYKAHIQQWQHLGVVRTQPDALSYECNYADLDSRTRDRSGVGMPVVRVTYRMQPNEIRQSEFFASKGAQILREMGAASTWAGPFFTGVASSHDLGGTRMSDDPKAGVLDRNLRVHDTPGLYVFSGSAFPTCPGINPTLTLWALAELAAENLVVRLRDGKGL